MQTAQQIIERLNGVTAVAGLFDPHLPITTVSAWGARGKIPVKYWPRLIEGSDGAVTVEALMEANLAAEDDAA